MSTEILRKLVIDELTRVAEGKYYRKVIFKNGEIKLPKPVHSKKAKKLLDKILEQK
jgi:hypothetical protein